MKKPFYKRWIFWVIIIVVGGIIGLTTGKDDPAEQAAPTATKEAQEVSAVATSEPTTEPTEASVATEEPQVEVPDYSVVDQRLDKSGMWYLTLSTEATEEEQLRALVEHGYIMAIEQGNEVTSVFINIQNPGDPAYIAKGKLALSDKGVAQTGLSSTSDVEFEMLK